MGARAPTAKGMVLAEDRRVKALDLRKAGATYQQIAAELGMSKEGARQSVKVALSDLQAVCAELAEEVRQIESERLDAMTLGLWDRARRGDVPAVQAVLKVMDHRARLLGLSLERVQTPEGNALLAELLMAKREKV